MADGTDILLKTPHLDFADRTALDGTEEFYTQNDAWTDKEQKFTLQAAFVWILEQIKLTDLADVPDYPDNDDGKKYVLQLNDNTNLYEWVERLTVPSALSNETYDDFVNQPTNGIFQLTQTPNADPKTIRVFLEGQLRYATITNVDVVNKRITVNDPDGFAGWVRIFYVPAS